MYEPAATGFPDFISKLYEARVPSFIGVNEKPTVIGSGYGIYAKQRDISEGSVISTCLESYVEYAENIEVLIVDIGFGNEQYIKVNEDLAGQANLGVILQVHVVGAPRGTHGSHAPEKISEFDVQDPVNESGTGNVNVKAFSR